jgi:predicted phosphodiesterase
MTAYLPLSQAAAALGLLPATLKKRAQQGNHETIPDPSRPINRLYAVPENAADRVAEHDRLMVDSPVGRGDIVRSEVARTFFAPPPDSDLFRVWESYPDGSIIIRCGDDKARLSDHHYEAVARGALAARTELPNDRGHTEDDRAPDGVQLHAGRDGAVAAERAAPGPRAVSGGAPVGGPVGAHAEHRYLRPQPRARAGGDSVYRILVISDPHLGGGEDRWAWNCALKSIPVVNPDCVVLLGDVLDLESMSSHAAHGRRPSLRQELDSANAQLDRVQRAADGRRVVMLEGNHEDRYMRTLSQRMPELLGSVNTISEHMRVEERGWEWVPFRRLWVPYDDAPVAYTHGAWANKHCAHSALVRYKMVRSVRFGHVHRSQKHVIGHDCGSRVVMGVASPTCRVIDWESVKYTQGPPDWSHGIGVDEMSPCGAHSMNNYEMTDRRIVYGGTVIDGRSQ